MKRTMTFFLLFVKRLCRKPSFVLILLLMPAMVISMRFIIEEDDETVRVAVLCEDKNEKMNVVMDNLTGNSDLVKFYKSDSLTELRTDVLTNDAECGIVFTDGVWDALVEEDADEKIVIYQSSKSSYTDYIQEMVYSAFFSELAQYRLESYLDKYSLQSYVTEAERNEYIEARYDEYMKEGGTFEIYFTDESMDSGNDVSSVAGDNSYLFKPVRGILAVIMMAASLAGAVFRTIDEKDGVYKTLSYREKPYINLAAVFIPTMLSCITALVCIFAAGVNKGTGAEIGRMTLYCLLLTGFSNLLRCVINSEALLCSLLTMLTAASMIGCDIVINLAAFVKGIKVIRWVLPVGYYMEKMNSTGGIIITALVTLALIAAGIVTDRKKAL